MGWTVGAAVAGWLLGLYGYQANAAQNVNTLFGIRLLVSLMPAAACGLTVLAAPFYNLDAVLEKRIERELAVRRQEGAAVEPVRQSTCPPPVRILRPSSGPHFPISPGRSGPPDRPAWFGATARTPSSVGTRWAARRASSTAPPGRMKAPSWACFAPITATPCPICTSGAAATASTGRSSPKSSRGRTKADAG